MAIYFFGAIGVVMLAGIAALRIYRSRIHRTLLSPEQKERRLEIEEAVGKASVLRNVDPWGEVMASHLAKLGLLFNAFVARSHRAKADPASIRTLGTQLYLDCMEHLHLTSTMLHRLTLVDAAYFREILQNKDSVSAEDYRSALTELAMIQGLEEQIQAELSKTEAAIVIFNEALKLLDLRQDPTAVISDRRVNNR